MNINGEIILIEDDADDRELMEEAINHVIKTNNYQNKLVVIEDSSKVIDYIHQSGTFPFLVLSDINMPKMNGLELRRKISEDPQLKDNCIPYIFITTAGSNHDYIKKAYELSAQGYFSKPMSYGEYKSLMQDIVRYWKESKVPPKNIA